MLSDWIEAMRPRTLPVSVAGVVAASSLACAAGSFDLVPALLCFLFALLAQIASNFANEYYDFKGGLDKKGRVGPRRGVTEGSITPKAMLYATVGTVALACVFGLGLLFYGPWWLILVGIFVAVGVFAYSAGPYPLSHHGWGDVAVLFFFGFIPVNFTFYLQVGTFSVFSFLLSLAIGLMSVNVLIVNNYRDADDDRAVGKKTTVVLLGRKIMSKVYLYNGIVAAVAVLPVLAAGEFIVLWIIPLMVYVIMHVVVWYRLITLRGRLLNKVLGQTARNMLVFALLYLIICLFGLID